MDAYPGTVHAAAEAVIVVNSSRKQVSIIITKMIILNNREIVDRA